MTSQDLKKMTSNETSLKELLQFAHRLADAAEESILSRFRSKLTVEDKTDSSPVTIADREAEQEMRNLIQSLFPDHGIIGEEHGEMNPNSPLQWVLDPIDGTRAFITGNPLFGTLIGLMEQGNPRLGVINIPATGERWTSAEGLNCHYQNKSGKEFVCKVSGITRLSEVLMYSTDPSMFDQEQTVLVDQLIKKVKSRRYGGDCYLYGMLAGGWIDLVVEADMKLYDVMALIPVVQSAGGVISDWKGNPIQPGWDGTVLASASPELHQQVVKILKTS